MKDPPFALRVTVYTRGVKCAYSTRLLAGIFPDQLNGVWPAVSIYHPANSNPCGAVTVGAIDS